MCLSKKILYQDFVLFNLFRTAFFTKNVKEKTTKCSLKITEVLLDADGHVLTFYSFIFMKVQVLKTVLRATQTLDVIIFFKKCFALCPF